MKIIANMIGRNESGRYLENVLSHLNSFVDCIVFTDDASTDDTFIVAQDYGANVLRIDESLFGVNESTLRSIAWEHLSAYAEPNDWILAIDCDEVLYGTSHLEYILSDIQVGAIGVYFYHMWNETHYRIDKAWRPDSQLRLFRFQPDGWIPNKRLACGSVPAYVPNYVKQHKAVLSPHLRMQHWGYARDEDKLMKHERYMELDGGRFHSLRHLESILDRDPVLVKWDD